MWADRESEEHYVPDHLMNRLKPRENGHSTMDTGYGHSLQSVSAEQLDSHQQLLQGEHGLLQGHHLPPDQETMMLQAPLSSLHKVEQEEMRLPSRKEKESLLKMYAHKLGLNNRGCYLAAALAIIAFLLLVIIIAMAACWPVVSVSCLVSGWGPWAPCDLACGGGSRERSREVTRQPEGEGDKCPSLTESQSCNQQTCPGSQVPTGLVLAGGWGDYSLSSVETFPSRPACSIPNLPQGRRGLSLTLLPGDGGRLVACGGYSTESSCVSWRRGQEAWTHYFTLREKRLDHSAAGVEGGKVMLLGGEDSPDTGEIVGAEGTFSLQHGGEGSCALGVKEGREVVVTGGYSDGSSYGFVDRYSSDGSFLGELPGLKNTRYYHGCSVYTSASGTFYLVTGGKSLSGSTLLSSTEMLDPRTGSWQEVSPFPRHLYALACDSPRPGTVVCAGGSEIGGFNVRDEVLLFLALENRWEQIGRLGTKRYYHGLVAGSLDFCEDPE